MKKRENKRENKIENKREKYSENESVRVCVREIVRVCVREREERGPEKLRASHSLPTVSLLVALTYSLSY